MFVTILLVTAGVQDAISIQWVEARDAAKNLIMHKRTPSRQRRIIWPKYQERPAWETLLMEARVLQHAGGLSAGFFLFSSSILDQPLPRSRRLINPVQPTLCWYAEVCLQWVLACALLWLRKTEAICAQQQAGRGRSWGRAYRFTLPGFIGAEGPQLQTPLNLFTFGCRRCGVRLGNAEIKPPAKTQ